MNVNRLSHRGSYRNLTVVLPGHNYFFFSRLFKAFCEQDITKLAFKRWNLLYNVFIYSNYRIGLKIFNFKLQMLCVINWKKINGNKFKGNQQWPFPGQHYSFQGFFQTFPYLWSSSRVFKTLNWLIEQGLTSHQTHYRSYQGRFLQVIWPNQQCQSTEGSQLVFQVRLESHQHHSTMLQ